MKKTVLTFFLMLIFCSSTFADSYYFKECRLTDLLVANYSIDFEENVIRATLIAKNGDSQELMDKIKLVTKNKIISEMLPSGKGKDNYFQYYLDVDSESTIKQSYKKEKGSDIFRLQGPKKRSYCANVKAGWDMNKINKAETSKEEEQILLTRKKIQDVEAVIRRKTLQIQHERSYLEALERAAAGLQGPQPAGPDPERTPTALAHKATKKRRGSVGFTGVDEIKEIPALTEQAKQEARRARKKRKTAKDAEDIMTELGIEEQSPRQASKDYHATFRAPCGRTGTAHRRRTRPNQTRGRCLGEVACQNAPRSRHSKKYVRGCI